MRWATEEELGALEARHPEGLPCGEIVTLVDAFGVKFSEATLRKWVQWDLLPRSVRVGHRGAQAGSQGLYPATIVRRILEIKRKLGDGFSIEQIKAEGAGVQIELEALEQQIESVLSGAEKLALVQSDEVSREHSRRELRAARVSAEDLVSRLRAVKAQVSARTSPLARAGVAKAG